jgi:hypothetical protein
MVARPFAADQLSSDLDDLRQIQVVPFHPAIIHTLEARIEAAPDVDDNRIRVATQEILGEAVEFAAFQDHSDPAKIVSQGQRLLQGFLIQLADQFLGPLVFDKGIGAL